MYKKIWGLRQLEKLSFPYPPYEVIDISGNNPVDINEYVLKKIRQVGIPQIKGDRIGVTIRVSLPGTLDKFAKHGGLHVTEEKEVLKRVLDRYQRYKPDGKIVVQHTVDARCSGTLLKEHGEIVVETIFGDAPPLLEGESVNYETWIFQLRNRKWKKEKAYKSDDREVSILMPSDIHKFEEYAKFLVSNTYLEWSISKSNKLYFYEYLKLKNGTDVFNLG